ncbi:hypothetical protein NAC44_18815 [Allorhizobium sp. BGMRC 0089]|uniref:hypothetical protein n=1 Tax=Allorhizobium sonneratiae TaxID=2934936 RepID=UPI002034139D|nr:hypothetical protein [Allorhizobium sonneratiae]MCM2294381.1 hypothetical protein [Allorhizobium sonneratiae]
MNTLRSLVWISLGVVVAALAAAMTLSLTMVAGLVMSLALGWRMMSLKQKPMPLYARARKQQARQPVRIWNDGNGTIIDM